MAVLLTLLAAFVLTILSQVVFRQAPGFALTLVRIDPGPRALQAFAAYPLG